MSKSGRRIHLITISSRPCQKRSFRISIFPIPILLRTEKHCRAKSTARKLTLYKQRCSIIFHETLSLMFIEYTHWCGSHLLLCTFLGFSVLFGFILKNSFSGTLFDEQWVCQRLFVFLWRQQIKGFKKRCSGRSIDEISGVSLCTLNRLIDGGSAKRVASRYKLFLWSQDRAGITFHHHSRRIHGES